MARRAKGEGSVRLRKDGRWEGTFEIKTNQNGKRIRKSVFAKTKAECIEKLNETKEKYVKEQHILESRGYLLDADPLLRDWYKIWIETFCEGVIKEYTVRGYQRHFETYILPKLGDLHLSEISHVICQQFCTDLLQNGRRIDVERKGTGLSSVTVQDIRRTLSICLERALAEDLINKNPTKKIKIPNDDKVEMQTLKREDIQVFLEEAKRSGLYEFYLLELSTGLRLGEITALTWDDFDEEKKTITVNKTASRLDGKIIISTPKTPSSNRTIMIPNECVTALKALKVRKLDESDLIFPSPKGRVREGAAVTRQLHRIQLRAGLPRIRFHDLRHTFATLMLEQGVDVKTVSQMLGHTDAGFTMRTYMHVTERMQEQAATAMSEIIQQNGSKSAKEEF
jgi:integrase